MRTLLAFLLSAIALPSYATLVQLEPDDFAVGTDISVAFTGVTLSVEGRPLSRVQSIDGFSQFNGRNLATTGSLPWLGFLGSLGALVFHLLLHGHVVLLDGLFGIRFVPNLEVDLTRNHPAVDPLDCLRVGLLFSRRAHF